VATFEIGAYRNGIANGHILYSGPTRHYFDRQFMPKDAWITKKRLLAGKGMQISATNADPADPYLDFPGGWWDGALGFAEAHIANVM
jgi:hypothetical protein